MENNITNIPVEVQIAMANNEFWLEVGSGVSGIIVIAIFLLFMFKMME